jgi:arginase
MVDLVHGRVRAAVTGGRFPLLYGAHCAVLLEAVPALANALAAAGLVFIDGHDDASPMEHSTSGEAANMEVALQVTAQASGWWLHIDLDVLDREEFSACGAAGSALG